MTAISPQDFRTAAGQFCTGVSVVTALGRAERSVGMTVNSFASVSLDPPLVLWSVDKSAPEYEDFAASDHCAIHILREDQQQLSNQFSNDQHDKFAGLNMERGIADLPLLSPCLVRMQCLIQDRHIGGDHLILVARVLDIDFEPGNPLVFFSSNYRELRA